MTKVQEAQKQRDIDFIAKHLDLLTPDALRKTTKSLRKKFDAGVAAAKNPGVFNKLSQRQKAVALAQDVIANIRLDKFMVEHRGYITNNGEPDAKEGNLSVGTAKGAQCLINAGCTVCAKGALFMSSVLKTNKVKVYDVLNADNDDMRTRVLEKEQIFDKKSYDLIEVAFEGDEVGDAGDHLDESYRDTYGEIDWDAKDDDVGYCKRNYYNVYSDPRERLVAIMLNVIDHDGVFNPSATVLNTRVQKELK